MSLTPEQIEIRKEGVGASETAAALGISRMMTQQELWAIKTGRALPPDDNALFRLGHVLEPYIVDECERATGIVGLKRKPETLRRGRMIAHLDGLGTWREQLAVVEAKSRASRENFGEPGSSDIPDDIQVQCAQQMLLSGATIALVPVLFVRPPVVTYYTEQDPELAALVEDGVQRFWWHVEHDIAPPVDPNSEFALEALRILYKAASKQTMIATPEHESWRVVLEDSGRWLGVYGKTRDAAKAHLLAEMKECSEMRFADGAMFRRKLVKRKGYVVEDSEYIDARFVKSRGETPDD